MKINLTYFILKEVAKAIILEIPSHYDDRTYNTRTVFVWPYDIHGIDSINLTGLSIWNDRP